MEFLTKIAPAAWVKRLLLWQMFDAGLIPYFTKGRIQARYRAMHALYGIDEFDWSMSSEERHKLIESNFDKETAAKIIAAGEYGDLDDDLDVKWDENEEPRAVGFGFILYSDKLNWDTGEVSSKVYEARGDIEDHLFWDRDEHLVYENMADYWDAHLQGLSFDKSVIEMMLPTAESAFVSNGSSISSNRSFRGRPTKWDWEGAITQIVSLAQHPDGLPTGHGAQAKIEESIADWFITETGESPSKSQIRQRASQIMKMVQN
ncbi:hypothetical protein [Parasphingorhabdus sp.]|uniref:hypothetical protein n=1 Tax=Parasphingorhabdus sp. TaxID=2709688 RepID=UPI003D2AEA94